MDSAQNTPARKGQVSLRKLILLVLVLAACASPGIPPGGPEDKAAPALLSIVPDTGKTGISPQAVIFHFDEVVMERPPGATSLNQLFLISPRDGTPSVDWHRRDITVRPSKGWRPNTTYEVTMLPGITDLRGNIRNTGARTVFSTGATIATGSIRGRLWDWVAGTPAQQAFVEAIRLPDSVSYISVPDSTGAFRVGHLPPGNFLVRGVIDVNKNWGLDPREAWDTTSLAVRDSGSVSLFAITRDSVAPVLTTVAADDSLTLRFSFSGPLDPAHLPGPADIRVQAADSVAVPVASVTPPPADTTAAGLKPPRAPPPQVLVVRLARPLRTGTEYRVSVARVTGITGVSAPAVRTFRATAPVVPVTPPPAAPRTTQAAPVKK
jgi:hypothetical protein